PAEIFLSAEDFFVRAKAFRHADIESGAPIAQPLPELAVERRAADPLHRLKAFLSGTPARVMLLAESPGRRETLAQYLAEYGLDPAPCAGFEEFRRSEARLALGVAPLLAGFFLDSEALCFVPESELYAGTARPRAARAAGAGAAAQARGRPVGEGKAQVGARGARHRRGIAQPLRPARDPPGPRVQAEPARLRGLRRRLRLRGDARPGSRNLGCHREHEERQAHGSPRLRRRRFREDRGRATRRLRRRRGQHAGRGARAHHAPRRA